MKPQIRTLCWAVLGVGSIAAGILGAQVWRSRLAVPTTAPRPAGEVQAGAALIVPPASSARPDLVTSPGLRLLEQVRHTQEAAQGVRALARRLGELTELLARPEGRGLEELERAAADRRAVLKQLIPQDPAEVLRNRLNTGQRRALPPSVQVHLEEVVDAFARLEVLAVCGRDSGGTERFAQVGSRRFRAYPAGSRSEIVSQVRMPVHGLAVDGLLAIGEDPYRIVVAEETLGVPALEEGVTAMVGDERRHFVSLADLSDWAGRIRAEETALPSVFGVRKILFIMVDFSDAVGAPTSVEEISKSMVGVNSFYGEMSSGRTEFKFNTILYRAPKTKEFYNSDPQSYFELMTDAQSAARRFDASNGASGTYSPEGNDHVALVFKKIDGYTGFSGLGDILGKRLWFNNDWSPATVAHELGHNLGLSHSYAWVPSGLSPIGPGVHKEYGDVFDIMGNVVALENVHFCLPKKKVINYISDANVVNVAKSGQFRIFRHDGQVGSKAVGIKVNAGDLYDYWLEYRKAVPVGLSAYSDALANGLQVRWNKIPSFAKAGATGTYLLDMTPGSAGEMKDSMLTLGQSFYDPTYKIRITPIQTGTSVDGDWIDVAVVIGDFPNNKAPAIQSASASEAAFARVPVALTAAASDADGDAVLYQWDFGDGVPVYSASGNVTRSWASAGTYNVTVKSFDVFGGESRLMFKVVVSDPLASWTKVAVSGLSEDLNAVCFGQGKFVAAGTFATCSSTDGVRWTKSTSGTATMYVEAIVGGPQRFVAVGGDYSFAAEKYGTGIFTSVDGVNWSTIPSAGSEWLRSVTFGAGKYVAVGDSGILCTSSDGVNWSRFQLISKKDLKAVQFNGTQFMAVGADATAIISSDGTNWRDVSLTKENTPKADTTDFSSQIGYALAYANRKWLVSTGWFYPDKSGRFFWSSEDGSSWSVFSGAWVDFYAADMTSVGSGSWAVCFPIATADASIAVSADGRNWTVQRIGVPYVAALRWATEGNGRIVIVGDKGQIFLSSDGPPAIAKQPQSQTVTVGGRVSLSVAAYATGPFTYQWRRNGAVLPGATGETVSIAAATAGDSGDYTVVVSNNRGVVVSAAASVLVQPAVAAPVFAASPVSQTVSQGGSVQLLASATGYPAPAYQWFKDGVALAGMTGTTLTVAGDGSANGGAYTVTATNPAGSATSGAAIVRVIPSSRLANISVRSTLQAGDTLIVGAVVTEGTRGLLIRAAGPALAPFGLSGLPDPALELYGSGSQLLTSNNDWSSSLAPVFQSVGAFAFPPGSKDAALSPVVGGAFTAQVKGGGSGAVLVEAYDLGSGFTPRLVNLSARYRVGTGADVLIAGFSLAGSGSKQVLIRAVGPTLSQFGVSGVLVDPQLEVLDSSGRVLGSNDTWAPSLSATFSRLGAFPLQSGSKDAALLMTLPAGANYSVKVSGVNGTTGEAMVEVYEVF